MTTFTNQTKNTPSTFVNDSANASSPSNEPRTYYHNNLLMEDGSYLLQEDGNKIILEQDIPYTSIITNLNKS